MTIEATNSDSTNAANADVRDHLIMLDCWLSTVLTRLRFLHEYLAPLDVCIDREALHLLLGDTLQEAQEAEKAAARAWATAQGGQA